MIKSLLSFTFFILLTLNAFALSLSLDPHADFDAFAYSNHSVITRSSNLSAALFVPVSISSSNSPVAIYANPFFKSFSSGVSKLSLAYTFVDISLDNISLKAGRLQLYNQNIPLLLYFANNNNFDNSFPSYIDAISAEFSFDSLYAQAFASNDIFGFHSNIYPFSFLTLSPFAYAKLVTGDKLFILGSSANFSISQNISLFATLALNAGSKDYCLFNSSFHKDYNASFYSLGSDIKLPTDYAFFNFNLNYLAFSNTDNNSLPFSTFSNYNPYGYIPASNDIFSIPVNAFKFSAKIHPYNLDNFSLSADLFYYYSALSNDTNRYLASEFNIKASLSLHNYDFSLLYAFFDPKFITQELNPILDNNNLHKIGLFLSIKNLL